VATEVEANAEEAARSRGWLPKSVNTEGARECLKGLLVCWLLAVARRADSFPKEIAITQNEVHFIGWKSSQTDEKKKS